MESLVQMWRSKADPSRTHAFGHVPEIFLLCSRPPISGVCADATQDHPQAATPPSGGVAISRYAIMLLLSRREGDSVCIGSEVTVSIGRISGGRVQIKIAAPRSVNVRRVEFDGDATFTPAMSEVVTPLDDSASAVSPPGI